MAQPRIVPVEGAVVAIADLLSCQIAMQRHAGDFLQFKRVEASFADRRQPLNIRQINRS
jgi:hypothetical protein